MSTRGSTLFYFTESYPFGLGESWKTNELRILSHHYSRIYVVPAWYANNRIAVAVPGENITVLKPALEQLYTPGAVSDVLMLMKPFIFKELVNNKGLTDRNRIRKCIDFVKTATMLLQSSSFKFVLEQSDENSVWYFFWGRVWADVLPFIRIPNIDKIAIRLHGYDLYLERNHGYIPFRKEMFEKADLLLPISDTGAAYIKKKYAISDEKIAVSRLGTISAGIAKPGVGQTLNLLSCSGMVPVKRLDRIINSLKLITDFPVRWVHIGTGPMFEDILKATAELSPNIEVHFAGKLTAEEVLQYYVQHEADLFINTSESEGVPVSIMEAFSAGIPVVATNVGGTAEIVDDTVGKLLTTNPEPQEIATILKDFHSLSPEQRSLVRQRAFQRYQEKCDANKWAEHLHQLLQ